VRSYREGGKVKQEVVHLGQYSTAQSALESWPQEVKELRKNRPKQAKKLQDKLNSLQELTKGADLTPTNVSKGC
jgi:hypothetical protein